MHQFSMSQGVSTSQNHREWFPGYTYLTDAEEVGGIVIPKRTSNQQIVNTVIIDISKL